MFKSVFVVFIVTIAFANCDQGLDLKTAIGNTWNRTKYTSANIIDSTSDIIATSINTVVSAKKAGFRAALQGTSHVLNSTGQLVGTVIDQKGKLISTIGDAVKNVSSAASNAAVESLQNSETSTTGNPYAFQGLYLYSPQGAYPYSSPVYPYRYPSQGGYYQYPATGGSPPVGKDSNVGVQQEHINSGQGLYPYQPPGVYPYPPPGVYPYPPPGGYPYPPPGGYPYQYPSHEGYPNQHPPKEGSPKGGSPPVSKDSNVDIQQTHINSGQVVRASPQPLEAVHLRKSRLPTILYELLVQEFKKKRSDNQLHALS